MTKRMLEVCDLYTALKADGGSAGKPCVILRLGKSNLSEDKADLYRYAWDKTLPSFDTRKKVVELEVLADKVFLLLQNINTNYLVVTGGEPLLQQEAVLDFLKLYGEKYNKDLCVDIETNGTITPLDNLHVLVSKYSVNIHLGSSMTGNIRDTFSTRVNKEAIETLKKNPHSDFIFSILGEGDFTEIEEISKMFGLSKASIFIRPAGVATGAGNWKLLYNACLGRGLRLSPKFDLQVFGSNINILNNNI